MRLRRLLVLLAAVAPAVAAAAPPGSGGMVRVPGGDVSLGSDRGHFDEAPVHRVRLSPFLLDQFEVTQGELAAFVRETGAYDRLEGAYFRSSAEACVDLIRHHEALGGSPLSRARPLDPAKATREELAARARWRSAVAALLALTGQDASGGVEAIVGSAVVAKAVAEQARLPAVRVTWRDAVAFCAASGKRLPTEAEWEHAARGSDGRAFPSGASYLSGRCVLDRTPEEGPLPVGSREDCTSPYGASDLEGNVWEWVSDWYGERYYEGADGARDPQGPVGLSDGRLPGPRPGVDLLRSPLQGREQDTRKVIRGGSYAGGGEAMARFNARASRRLYANPAHDQPDVGFRCARGER